MSSDEVLESRPSGPTRRGLFTAAGAAGAAGLVAGAAGERYLAEPTDRGAGASGARDGDASDASASDARLDLVDRPSAHDDLPVGLAEPVPAFGHLIACNLSPASRSQPARARAAAIAFLQRMTGLADSAGAQDSRAAAALDLRPATLQVTPGVGASLLAACGLAAKRPDALIDLPAFATDRLQPGISDGDLMVQVAAEDPMKVAGLVQQIVGGLAEDGLVLRWSRPGFRPTAAAEERPTSSPRNLMGHHDGTDNPEVGSPLWLSTVRATGPSWMRNGSYVVVRRIRIDLDDWFTHSERERDRVIGRQTVSGAPLSGSRESDPLELTARGTDGELTTPGDAHVRLANTLSTDGARIYRRSWNYDDGWSPDGSRDAGLLFLAWQADPRRGFVPIQRSLVRHGDALNRFTTHVGSAVFAVPARGTDDWVGQRLLEAGPGFRNPHGFG